MTRTKVEFTNRDGQALAGALELPDSGPMRALALFAHCFTCGKDGRAAGRIARELAQQGVGVLRFDFTGLGNSDGDFGNTNFSSNVQDLEDAAAFLARDYRAPSLLIGHSLGGAAALVAASRIDSVEAVVTLAAPASPAHVQHLFADASCDIRRDGQADVSIAGRSFTIREQFLDDLEDWSARSLVGELRKPLLLFHSPVDQVVPIDEAAQLYDAAYHPKSFVSLDQANHLLTGADDADYVAKTLAAWASRYLQLDPIEADTAALGEGEVLVTEADAALLRGLHTSDHHWLADEPLDKGGSNRGPNPYDLLLMSLGACTSMTLRMYANHKSLPVEDIEVRLRHERIHAEDCADCEHKSGMVDRIERRIRYRGDLDERQHERFLQIADRCPVHRTLTGEIKVITHYED